MKIVRIDYTVRDDVDLDQVKAAIAKFIAGIRAHDASHQYTSFVHVASPRQFTHLGIIAADRLADLQAQPFFGDFAGFLRAHCVRGPEVTWLDQVASTR